MPLIVTAASMRIGWLGAIGRSPDWPLRWKDLARIENAQRVERGLDGAHDGEAVAKLGLQVLGLALADAVLAGAGALHPDGALGQPVQERLDRGHLLRVGAIEHGLGVEVAVPGMAGDRGTEDQRLTCGVRLQQAISDGD